MAFTTITNSKRSQTKVIMTMTSITKFCDAGTYLFGIIKQCFMYVYLFSDIQEWPLSALYVMLLLCHVVLYWSSSQQTPFALEWF